MPEMQRIALQAPALNYWRPEPWKEAKAEFLLPTSNEVRVQLPPDVDGAKTKNNQPAKGKGIDPPELDYSYLDYGCFASSASSVFRCISRHPSSTIFYYSGPRANAVPGVTLCCDRGYTSWHYLSALLT